jgi:hypothetical protein
VLVHDRFDTIFKRNMVEPKPSDFEELVYYEGKRRNQKFRYKSHFKAGEREKEIFQDFKKRQQERKDKKKEGGSGKTFFNKDVINI